MGKHFDFRQFQCAIFDLDGTLLDSTGVWAKIDVDFLAARGIAVPADFTEEIKNHNFQSGSAYVKERFGLPESPSAIAKEWFEMAVRAYSQEIQLKEHAAGFLAMLKKNGLRLAVATSSDRLLYEPCLKRNGVYHLFDSFTQTDEVARPKGHPDVYELAARRTGTAAGDCVVFEDLLKGVQGAVSGGFYTVGVFDAASWQEWDQIRAACDLYIENYGELMAQTGREEQDNGELENE